MSKISTYSKIVIDHPKEAAILEAFCGDVRQFIVKHCELPIIEQFDREYPRRSYEAAKHLIG